MALSSRTSWIIGMAAVIVLAGIGAFATVAAGPGGDPRQLSEGAELLGEAAISVDEAIAAAQQVATGELQEVELEREGGRLIFEVEIGGQEVIIDAATGAFLGTEVEDGSEKDDDD